MGDTIVDGAGSAPSSEVEKPEPRGLPARVLAVLAGEDRTWTAAQMLERLGPATVGGLKPAVHVSTTLNGLVAARRAERVGRGVFQRAGGSAVVGVDGRTARLPTRDDGSPAPMCTRCSATISQRYVDGHGFVIFHVVTGSPWCANERTRATPDHDDLVYLNDLARRR